MDSKKVDSKAGADLGCPQVVFETMKNPATALWNWPLAAALVILSAALSFGAQCDALFNLDDDARNFLGTADTCQVSSISGFHGESVYLACETSKFAYILHCGGDFVDGQFVFTVVGDSLMFTQSPAPHCFSSIMRVKHSDQYFKIFPQWYRWKEDLGWNAVFSVSDSCMKWEEWNSMGL